MNDDWKTRFICRFAFTFICIYFVLFVLKDVFFMARLKRISHINRNNNLQLHNMTIFFEGLIPAKKNILRTYT